MGILRLAVVALGIGTAVVWLGEGGRTSGIGKDIAGAAATVGAAREFCGRTPELCTAAARGAVNSLGERAGYAARNEASGTAPRRTATDNPPPPKPRPRSLAE